MDEYGNSQSPTFSDDSSASQSTTMAKPPCSHWWHALFYLAMSLALAYTAFKTNTHAGPESPLHPARSLAFNASQTLRLHGGFHVVATLLQISPELFLPGPALAHGSTVFAIHDSAISNLSAPPWALRLLLRYHAVPSALPMAALRRKPPGFCVRTLVGGKNLVVTRNDAGSGHIEINNVSISHPDLFLDGAFSVHGVSGPFDVDRSPPCDYSGSQGGYGSDQAAQWTSIIRSLSSSGFVSFAIGLNSVVDTILRDYRNLSSVSVFAPPNTGFISSPSPFLDKIVKIHILPERFDYLELSAAGNSTLRTLVPSYYLKIDKFLDKLAVNGVEVTEPNLFLSDNFVIHGISREFDAVKLFTSFM
ncbi:fasciclin-like arabinogalactan protein [Striga asiatica]|uniref:Fasciclin-like arabinogalactan protein n=1 Tax=Striga asiatica TaxID=4170 RepID=A0A5A7NYB1_STRAF|nr:fasciclin-like arabinogalactan protein [Striga asiatica]